jgi:hypothetical protein
VILGAADRAGFDTIRGCRGPIDLADDFGVGCTPDERAV